jgi:hypothetical protein
VSSKDHAFVKGTQEIPDNLGILLLLNVFIDLGGDKFQFDFLFTLDLLNEWLVD